MLSSSHKKQQLVLLWLDKQFTFANGFRLWETKNKKDSPNGREYEAFAIAHICLSFGFASHTFVVERKRKKEKEKAR